MPKFSVILTRNTTESIMVEVNAANEELATQIALEETNPDNYDWEQDDTTNASKEIYATGVDLID